MIVKNLLEVEQVQEKEKVMKRVVIGEEVSQVAVEAQLHRDDHAGGRERHRDQEDDHIVRRQAPGPEGDLGVDVDRRDALLHGTRVP